MPVWAKSYYQFPKILAKQDNKYYFNEKFILLAVSKTEQEKLCLLKTFTITFNK